MSELEKMLQVHYDGVNSGELDTAMSVFDPDHEILTPNGPLKGNDAHKALAEGFRTAAPDNRLEAVRTYESGDTIIVEGVYSGTHTGPLVGPGGTIPATGRAFSFPFCELLQARDGKFVSHRVYWDNVTFLSQIGAIPAP